MILCKLLREPLSQLGMVSETKATTSPAVDDSIKGHLADGLRSGQSQRGSYGTKESFNFRKKKNERRFLAGVGGWCWWRRNIIETNKHCDEAQAVRGLAHMILRCCFHLKVFIFSTASRSPLLPSIFHVFGVGSTRWEKKKKNVWSARGECTRKNIRNKNIFSGVCSGGR